MAELLTQGVDALPEGAGMAVVVACVVGIGLALLGRVPTIKRYVPSGLAMGIAFIVPAFYSLVMFYGLVAWWIWKRRDAEGVANYNFALASGLVVGEGLMGMVNAALKLLGVSPLTGG